MAQITAEELDVILSRRRLWSCVETGGFQGHFTSLALRHFSRIVTVELSEPLCKGLREQFAGKNVTIVQGDSRQIVPVLAQYIEHPVFWFFDANWWYRPPSLDPGIAGSSDSYPIWDELRAVAPRQQRDVIVLNDVDTFGTISKAGRDRRDLTIDSVAALFPGAEVVVLNNQLAIYR